MGEAEICRIRRTLDEQQGLLGTLQREVTSCREEIGALRECLTNTGALDEVRFLVQLHRRSFAAVRSRYGLVLNARLDTVVGIPAIALTAGQSAGHTAMRRLREASKATHVAAGDILGLLCPGHVYVCGGFEGTLALSSTERFDPASQLWEAVPPMVEARQYTCSAVVSGRIYVCGGWGGPRPVSSVERLDPVHRTWEAMPPMLVARWGAAAGVVSGKLHICGGLDETRQPLSSVERLELASGFADSNGDSPLWESMPAMSERRGWPAAGALAGLLYVCGGRDEQREPLNSVERLRTDGTTWEPVAPMAEQRAGAAAAAVAGRLYVCGGAFGAQMLSSAERFDPKAQIPTWEFLPAMTSRRAYVAAAAVAGRLHVFGGNDGAQCLSSAEQFNPATGTWFPLPTMSERRSGAAATVLRG
eukprot:TRINITY_DN50322_c0_g1_i1.p1 TRINITY_DN50322_c0_g1~~TRINITY_DN50322_c0_g1_i1.p1  ORF type:complete len:418 (-),score=60.76 TRINITY_DN50322_c0_g1_i1:275-1528(-)